MKATTKTETRCTVTFSKAEIIGFARAAGIRIPHDVEVDVYGAPFDDDEDGILLVWLEVHGAEKQG